jgi:hypothetical protein
MVNLATRHMARKPVKQTKPLRPTLKHRKVIRSSNLITDIRSNRITRRSSQCPHQSRYRLELT